SLTKLIVCARRRRHTISLRDWSSDVCSSHLREILEGQLIDGGVLSAVHVTVLAAVAELPQPSEAINVLICEALHALVITAPSVRSEERRVGKECRSR